MAEKTFYVVPYDIVDNRRRVKASEALKDLGYSRVQKSVFECRLVDRSLKRLIERLEEIIDEHTDNVLIYRLCGACVPKKRSVGTRVSVKEEDFRIL